MKLRWAQRAGAVALLGLTTAILAPACVDNESTIVVEFVTTDFTECVDGDFMSLGQLDPLISSSYFNSIQVANQLVQHADEDRFRTETDIIVLREAEVTVESTSGTLSEFVWPLAGIIDAGGPGQARGKTSIGVLMIDPEAAAGAQDGEILISNIKVFGRTEGGLEVESPIFSFPIIVARGSLIDCTAGNDPDSAGFCDEAVAADEELIRPGEDCPVPCNRFLEASNYCNGL